MTEPTQHVAQTVDTTGADTVAAPLDGAAGDPGVDIMRLAQFLREQFPHETERVTPQFVESPVDTAIRLLQGLNSTAPASGARCHEAYCNKPISHTDEHGTVNYSAT